MKKLLVFSAFLCSMFYVANAQQVSVSDAMAKAKAFLQSSASHRAPATATAATPQLQLAYTCQNTTDQKVCYYVFNRGTNGGFIIMGGDEVAEEVLAYTDNGSFDHATIPDNFKWWLSQYQQQISSAMAYAEAHLETAKAAKARAKAVRRVATSSRVDVEPMLTTQWGQGEPYNNAIPSLGAGYTGNYGLATGCVATAMAQIMKYHNYPTKGVGSKSYQISWGSLGTFTYQADFANTTYDWENMTNTYNSSSSEVQEDAVATLMYHCGVSVNMKYGQIISGGSSGSTSTSASALVEYFRYNKSIRYLHREHYSNDIWEQMIYNELVKQHPILYDGQSTSGGHAFVCDGYKASDNTYHMNWGWEGYCDCFVKLTGTDAIKPGGTGTGGGGEEDSYDQSQGALLNIIPTEGGKETPVVYNSKNTISLKDKSTTISSLPYIHNHGTSKVLTLTANVWNLSQSLTSFNIGVKATETTTGYEYYFNTSKLVTLERTYLDDYSVTFDVNEIPRNGTYEINMVVCNTETPNDWYEVGAGQSTTLPTITITGASDQAKGDVPFGISSNSVQVSKTLQISHTASYKGNITYTSSNPSVATVSDNGVITGVAAGSTMITVIAAGDTYFNHTEKQFYVEVTPYVEEVKEMRFSKKPYFEQANPWAENMKLHLPLFNGSNETFSGKIKAVIHFSKSNLNYSIGVSLISGKAEDRCLDLSKYQSNFEAGKGKELTIQFYIDEACTKPFNIPSITYVYQDYLAGDVSGDGSLSADDIADIKSAVIKKSTSPKADFNSDGKVDIIDIVKLVDFLKK